MKVLFVSSGNSRYKISPLVKSQGNSILKNNVDIDFFMIKGKGIIGYLKNIKKLRVKAKNCDIIHAHYGLIGLLVGISFTNKPLVLSVMGTDITGNFKENGKRSNSSYVIMLMSQIALFFSKVIIVKSNNLMDYIPLFFRPRLHIIPNGVNFEKFKPMDRATCKKKLSINHRDKIILFLADPNKLNKNFKMVKEAVNKLKNPDIKLINPFPISQEEFVVYLNACDVFVLTSFSEGSPNVIKEAMACNCPIVSTNVGDVKSIIENTEGCYLSSFNSENLANQILKALMFGKRTTGRINITYLDSDKIAKKLKYIYESIN